MGKYIYFLGVISLLTFLFIIFFSFFVKPVSKTTYPKVFFIEEGESVRNVAENLKEANLIDSTSLFIVISKLNKEKVLYGTYNFKQSESLYSISKRLLNADTQPNFIRLLAIEGDNVYKLAEKILEIFPDFDSNRFIEIGLENHGFLYPETYFFNKFETPKPEEVINIMKKTFEHKTEEILKNYDGDLTLKELLSLAVLIELESGNDINVQRNVASVFYNRLEKDILLQSDVPFLFINGKNSFTLTRKDLKTNHPLNTYVHKGIPVIPVGNPSIVGIESALNPTETEYFYFLSDLSGKTHFSKTFKEHVYKKNIYLNR